LKKGGKIEEAAEWEEKARKLDDEQQEIWRNRIATSIVTSKWGGSGAQIDQMTRAHQTELNNLYKTQNMKRDVLYATHKTLRRNFENTLKAEVTRFLIFFPPLPYTSTDYYFFFFFFFFSFSLLFFFFFF
jgi:hypothetical protein